jgi:hypothetical protein
MSRDIISGVASLRWPTLPSISQLRDQLSALRPRLLSTIRELYQVEMRHTWYLVAAMILLGLVVNLWLPHGWTIWPIVFIAGIMAMVHEAAERNGQGVPPLHVYAAVAAVLALWILGAFIFSVINPLILLAGMAGIGYQCARAIIRQRERARHIARRRAEGCCIFCGAPANPELSFCESCGEEPDPDSARLDRVAGVVRTRNNAPQARAALTAKPETASTAAKEQALLARHHARKPRPR